MSEVKRAAPVLFHVVDRGGDRHSVIADRMLTEGREVTFTVDGREVGSFFDPLSAKASQPSVAPPEMLALVPGEVCVTSLRSRYRVFDGLLFGALVVNAALMAYDQFGRAFVLLY